MGLGSFLLFRFLGRFALLVRPLIVNVLRQIWSICRFHPSNLQFLYPCLSDNSKLQHSMWTTFLANHSLIVSFEQAILVFWIYQQKCYVSLLNLLNVYFHTQKLIFSNLWVISATFLLILQLHLPFNSARRRRNRPNFECLQKFQLSWSGWHYLQTRCAAARMN